MTRHTTLITAAAAVTLLGAVPSPAHASMLPNPKRVTSTAEQISGLLTELRHVTALGERQSIHDEIVLTYRDGVATEA
jgi:hypothetical protein